MISASRILSVYFKNDSIFEIYFIFPIISSSLPSIKCSLIFPIECTKLLRLEIILRTRKTYWSKMLLDERCIFSSMWKVSHCVWNYIMRWVENKLTWYNIVTATNLNNGLCWDNFGYYYRYVLQRQHTDGWIFPGKMSVYNVKI